MKSTETIFDIANCDNARAKQLAQRIANREETSRRARWMPVCKHGHIDCSMTISEGGDCFDETACELEAICGLELNSIALPEPDEDAVQSMLHQMSAG